MMLTRLEDIYIEILNLFRGGGVKQLVSDIMMTNCKIENLKYTHHPLAVSTQKYQVCWLFAGWHYPLFAVSTPKY